MKESSQHSIDDLNVRSKEVFRLLVESYLDTGDPVGSRTLTRSLSENISAATIRNVMNDLEFLGLLNAPHVSAGRIPTESGLRLFVDGLLEVGDINTQERKEIDASLDHTNDMACCQDQLAHETGVKLLQVNNLVELKKFRD